MDFMFTFCLFEPMDMIKFIFLTFDPENTGFVDKDEIRHFIYALHQTKENATIEQGLEYLDDHDDGDGRFEFFQIKDMHFRFQQLFYPAFRLLVQVSTKSHNLDCLYT
jgi:Ca2+-binding EF-hand superfamily protein